MGAEYSKTLEVTASTDAASADAASADTTADSFVKVDSTQDVASKDVTSADKSADTASSNIANTTMTELTSNFILMNVTDANRFTVEDEFVKFITDLTDENDEWKKYFINNVKQSDFDKRAFPANLVSVKKDKEVGIADKRHEYAGSFEEDAKIAKSKSGYQNHYIDTKVLQKSQYYDTLTMDGFNKIFNALSTQKMEKAMLAMICRFSASSRYCHLFFKNTTLLSTYKDFIASNIETIAKSAVYGWHVLYREEHKVRGMSDPDHRHMFKLSEAQLLPTTGLINDPMYCPIIGLDVDTLNTTMGCAVNPDGTNGFGLTTLPEFERRMHLYSGGVLKDLDWKNIAVTGSVMTLGHNNPLYGRFDTAKAAAKADATPADPTQGVVSVSMPVALQPSAASAPSAETFKAYFNEYFPGNSLTNNDELISDMDMMVDVGDQTEFIKVVNRVLAQVVKNTKKDVEITVIPSERSKLITYKNNTITATGKWPADPKSQHFRIRINAKHMVRPLELFRVYDFASSVVRFHFPCVRAYYNGSDVHCFNTYITAGITGMHFDYCWYVNGKHAIGTVMKYVQRGYGLVVSKEEIGQLVEFLSKMPEWQILGSQSKDMLGFKYTDSTLYGPSALHKGLHWRIGVPGKPGVINASRTPSLDVLNLKTHGNKFNKQFYKGQLARFPPSFSPN